MSDPRHTDNADGPLMAALMEWRQRLIDAGAVAPTSLKEVHIRQVARRATTDVDQLRAMLPGSVAEHAEDLARVIAALLAQRERGGNRTGAPDVDQPPTTPTPAPPPVPPPSRPAADDPTTTAIPAPSQAPPNRSAEPSLSATDFAPFTFATKGGGEVHPVSRRRLPGGQNDPGPIEFSWPPYLPGTGATESVVVYRLVSGDETPPIAPDRAHLVAATTATSARDDRPIDVAVRHYQVWVNFGGTTAAALAAQPVKHAAGVEIGPVRDVTLREEGGQVIGEWRVPPLITEVYVYRVPAEHQGNDRPEFRIRRESANLTGFRDDGVERGRRYRYVMRAATAVDGSPRLSENAIERDLEISVILAPIADLAMIPPTGGPMFDITWTPPPGAEVAVFRTPNGPSAGTDADELPESALEQIGLLNDLRLSQPVDLQGAGALMSSVVWPKGWNRVYLTPVTLLNGRALLGRTVSSVRTGVIRDVDLAEYCDKQVLTFTWPEGAHFVAAYPTPRGYDPRNGLTGRSFEITEDEYQRNGGLQLAAGELPYRGCSLCLQPVAYSAGRRVEGEICSVEYPGLLRLWYDIQISRDPETRQPIYATVSMRAQEDIPRPPSFVLVNNPHRIPLSRNDGAAVDVAPLNEKGQRGEVSQALHWAALATHPTGELWAANLRGKQGWIRLFANIPSAERLRIIALLDPPVEQLRLTSAAIR